VKALDPKRLVTASGSPIEASEVPDYLQTAGLDFLASHRPREKSAINETERSTQEMLEAMRKLGKAVPILYQEPFRRGYPFEGGEITAEDYLRDAEASKRGGAAGWCFHNGGERTKPDERPRRSFDLSRDEGRLFQQLDPVEREAVDRLAAALKTVPSPH
jgi:hypothetical protein